MTTRSHSLPFAQPNFRLFLQALIWVGTAFGIGLLATTWPAVPRDFPEAWNLGLRDPLDAFQRWVVANRASHPVFAFGFTPLSSWIDHALRFFEQALLRPGWPALLLLFALLGYLAAGVRLSLFCAGSLLLAGLFGLWEPTMQTLALMLATLLLAILIGVPLGMAAAASDRLDRLMRPVLDAMQTIPAFVYLVPVMLLFGIARVPAVIATLIYALPPMIRLTNLGIRQSNQAAVEAAQSFGATRWQILRGVQLPLALPSILMGVNQTIMMALGMVVIAAMIGAGGLGREVLIALQRLNVGRALEAGLIIVCVAMLLDRLSAALTRIDFAAPAGTQRQDLLSGWVAGAVAARLSTERAYYFQAYGRLINATLLFLAFLLLDALIFQFGNFPETWRLGLREPANAVVIWARDNLYFVTGPLSDGIVIYLLNPSRDLLLNHLPWPAIILAVAALAYTSGGLRLALGSATGMALIGLLGMWTPAMETLSQVILMVLLTVAIAVPLGLLAAQSPRFSAVLRPILDLLQTIPAFVYLVPVIMLFNIGRVPGLIAAVLYALPPGIRLIQLGIETVPSVTVEAAESFGSSRWQTLIKVQIPQALPSIMLAINQIIVMVLAMVIIAGLVGGAGLGIEAVRGLARSETGRGIEAGLAIMILAIILDRITQAWAKSKP
ncbi:MAG: ABC transporter permease subunit [Candidatus Viridilinea halotolerans]|uniref:ABC transporter permease subunit n=1 Tax=Candidatus Viridilinea halotolerans TaxID=2491704 RepID=A0A426TXW9_9CHLR|nr:MAG: ABC transporter permease subunit [Candidatus Viridilinea halotolerans]